MVWRLTVIINPIYNCSKLKNGIKILQNQIRHKSKKTKLPKIFRLLYVGIPFNKKARIVKRWGTDIKLKKAIQ
jgi:hypothetical protein